MILRGPEPPTKKKEMIRYDPRKGSDMILGVIQTANREGKRKKDWMWSLGALNFQPTNAMKNIFSDNDRTHSGASKWLR